MSKYFAIPNDALAVVEIEPRGWGVLEYLGMYDLTLEESSALIQPAFDRLQDKGDGYYGLHAETCFHRSGWYKSVDCPDCDNGTLHTLTALVRTIGENEIKHSGAKKVLEVCPDLQAILSVTAENEVTIITRNHNEQRPA